MATIDTDARLTIHGMSPLVAAAAAWEGSPSAFEDYAEHVERSEATPFTVTGIDQAQGSDDPARPRGQSLYAEFMRAEQQRHRLTMEAWRAEFERGYLRPAQKAWLDVLADSEAAKAARPSIGKAMSRRARRRNRGRVRAERARLARLYAAPVRWEWSESA